MKIAIISDIHDNLKKLSECLQICQQEKINKIICCGDVSSLDTLKFISTNFLGEVFLVEGNAETFLKKDLAQFSNINFCGLVGYTELDDIKIGFCHKPKDIALVFKGVDYKLDFIFYGHTHKPWLEKEKGTMLVNPGNIAGIFYQSSFALFDTKTRNLELKIINN